MVTHSHSYTTDQDFAPRWGLRIILGAIVAAIAAATIFGIIALWPDADKIPRNQSPYGAQGVTIIDAKVTAVKPFDCDADSGSLDGLPVVDGDCAKVTANASGESPVFNLDSARYAAGIKTGDDIQVIRIQPKGQPVSYEFLEFERGVPLTALALAFAVLVIVVARWRGLFALLGVAVTMFALMKFMLPALLAGENGLAVAIVGSTAIMLVVLYLAHGVSIRTTSALFGTLFGLALTAAFGLASTGWTNLTGLGSEDDRTLAAIAPNLSLTGVVTASMVVAGLGVLNDVTVTQASAVWELRVLQPTARARDIFTSAMRIGRDHIASSVYTLVFAYAGSAMTILLLITAYQRGLAEMATTEEIGQEIVRTLVGATGLVLAVPITTVIAVLLAPKGATSAPEDTTAEQVTV